MSCRLSTGAACERTTRGAAERLIRANADGGASKESRRDNLKVCYRLVRFSSGEAHEVKRKPITSAKRRTRRQRGCPNAWKRVDLCQQLANICNHLVRLGRRSFRQGQLSHEKVVRANTQIDVGQVPKLCSDMPAPASRMSANANSVITKTAFEFERALKLPSSSEKRLPSQPIWKIWREERKALSLSLPPPLALLFLIS